MRPPPTPEKGVHFFAQDEREFEQLLTHVDGARSLLEIGSRYGETLWRFAKRMPTGSRIVSVDLGDDPFTPAHRTSLWWYGVCGRLAENYDIFMVQGDSHNTTIIERVRALGPFDFGFIDGDHSTHGVMSDWKDYESMCSILAFHDILLPTVAPIWRRAKEGHQGEHREYVESGKWGIGVLL